MQTLLAFLSRFVDKADDLLCITQQPRVIFYNAFRPKSILYSGQPLIMGSAKMKIKTRRFENNIVYISKENNTRYSESYKEIKCFNVAIKQKSINLRRSKYIGRLEICKKTIDKSKEKAVCFVPDTVSISAWFFLCLILGILCNLVVLCRLVSPWNSRACTWSYLRLAVNCQPGCRRGGS